MSTSLEWARAFARQALSDLEVHQVLTTRAETHKCQRLHFLQMAAEKVCKAYLYAGGVSVSRSHAVVQKYLPVIVRNLAGERELSGTVLKQIRQLAREIEVLAPACDERGARPDNTEYPWLDRSGVVITPAEYGFPEIDESDRTMVPVIRYLRLAAKRYSV